MKLAGQLGGIDELAEEDVLDSSFEAICKAKDIENIRIKPSARKNRV